MKDSLGYAGKRVVVSGCFSGMGHATARMLLELGAEVHGLDFKQPTLDLASFQLVDLRDPLTIDAAAAAIGGKVDALFNCAGLGPTFPPMDIVKVNFIGARHLTQRLLPRMGEGAAICTISSTAGMGWSQRLAAHKQFLQIQDYAETVRWCEENSGLVGEGYGFSKEAIVVWTALNSQTLIKRGVRINCILPGPTQTPMMENQIEVKTAASVLQAAMQPINRRARPEEQAGALVMLNSALASYINGEAINVDGGFSAGVKTGLIDLRTMMGGGV